MIRTHQSLYESIVEAALNDENTKCIIDLLPSRRKITYVVSGKRLLNDVSAPERKALKYLNRGDRILDIGAGAGRISLYLQEKGYNVVALDKSKTICSVLKKRGIKQIVNVDILKYMPKTKYDSALLIMVPSIFGKRGQNLAKLYSFLKQNVLKKEGNLIIISTFSSSNRPQMLKRRFIFKDKIGPWFESIIMPIREAVHLARENGFIVRDLEKFRHPNRYLLVLENK